MIVYLNGKFVQDKKAVVSIHDHGFLYGDGIYETIRVYNGHPFYLKEHLKRLVQSAKGIGLRIPESIQKIEKTIYQLILKNRQKQAAIRITVTRGIGPYGFDPRKCKKPTLVITSSLFDGYPKHFYEKGIKVAVVSIQRNDPASLPPWVKSTSCLNGILAKAESIQLGCDEALMLTSKGYLSEGSVSNVFIVKKNVIKTPKLMGNLLPGVTRQVVCTLARKAGLKVEEKNLKLKDLITTDEVFLTNTLMGVMPVRECIVQNFKRKVRLNPKGPVTRIMRVLFQSFVRSQRNLSLR